MDVPIGHKIALTDIKAGDTVWKYGQDIGKAVADIGKGQHVHVHNLKTKRW
jgi:(2R)-sulfolactate sulfo-lyase subunit alpha